MKNDQKQVPITVFDLSNQLDDWFQRGDALSHFNSDFLETSLFFIIFTFCFSSLLNLCFFFILFPIFFQPRLSSLSWSLIRLVKYIVNSVITKSDDLLEC